MKIAVVGAGAIGGWIAGRLAIAGRDPGVLVRPGRSFEDLTLVENGEEHSVAVRTTDQAATLGRQDLVVFAVKAPALADAAEAAATLIGPDTVILPMLNGVPWWFADGGRCAQVDPGRRHRRRAAVRASGRLRRPCRLRRDGPARVVVTHADKMILGDPAGGAGERVDRSLRFVRGRPASAPSRAPISAAPSGTNCGAMRRSTPCRR